jgi:hypothetical protein
MPRVDGATPVSHLGALASRALDEHPRGTVAALHRHAVTLRLDGGPVVAVVASPGLLHPFALVAPIPLAAASPGAPVSCDAGRLAVGPVLLDLADAAVLELRLESRPSSLPRERIARLAARASEVTRGLPEAIGSALEAFRHGGSPAPLANLVGLGEGLTPSADDAIVGALAALDLASHTAPRASTRRSALVAALPADLEARTPTVSVQALRAAVSGHYAAPLLALLQALACQGSPERLDEAVAGLLALGHRSGADTLGGVWAALEAAVPTALPGRA